MEEKSSTLSIMSKKTEKQIITSITQFVRDTEEGIKYDSEKPDYSLIPPNALDETVKVLTYGAKKYAPDNWRKLDNALNRYFAAAQRHMWAIKRGEIHDPETNLHHAAHAIASLMFFIELDK